MYDLQLCFYDFLKLDMEDFQHFLQNEKMLVCKCYLVKDYIQIKAGILYRFLSMSRKHFHRVQSLPQAE